MISDIIQEFVGGAVLDFLGLMCHLVGRIVVRTASLGRWRCDSVKADTSDHTLRAGGIYYVEDRRIHLTAWGTKLIGLLGILALICGGLIIWYWRS